MVACISLMRVNYQAALWQWAIQPSIRPPDPTNHGWSKSDDGISTQWFPD